MDFRFSAPEEAFRREIRDFIHTEIPLELRWSERVAHTDALWPSVCYALKKLAERGWLTMHWPREYGGQGVSPVVQMLFREEMVYWGLPECVANPDGPNLIGPTIIRNGSDHLKQTFLPSIARAEAFWCQGYTEPASGSDLAGLRTNAVEDGDHFIVSGQKDYNSGSARADWVHLLVSTDPNAPRHRGISYIAVDMHSPGVKLRGLPEANDRSGWLNEIFFDEVRVPKENLIGEKDKGWPLAMEMLNRARGGIEYYARSKRVLDDLVEYANATVRDGRPLIQGLDVQRTLGEMATGIEACRLASYRVAWLREQGHHPIHEASMSKLLGSEMWQRVTDLALQVMGLYGPLEPGSPGAPLAGRIEDAYVSSVANTIHLGTSEIQRNIIAQRGLGMPRE